MTKTYIFKKIVSLWISVIMLIAIASSFVPNECIMVSASSNSIPIIELQAHVQDKGWLQTVKGNGAVGGTTGEGLRLEKVRTRLTNTSGGIQISTHQSGIGWVSYRSADSGKWVESGTEGESRAIEAIRMKLYGTVSLVYKIEYRVHSANIGWGEWCSDGSIAGTVGRSLQAEALQVRLVPKYKPVLTYRTHVQNKGNTNYVSEGEISGTQGMGLAMEGLWVNLQDIYNDSGITYRVHVSNIGWQDWVSSNQLSGTVGQAKPIECVCLRLNSYMSNFYDIYYRVHCQDLGTLGYAMNGEKAGTVGGGCRAESIEIRILPKGSDFDRGGPAYVDLTTPNGIVPASEIYSAASRYGISPGSNAFKALQSINKTYTSQLSDNINGTNILFFEGVGNDYSITCRYNAMVVVVKGGKIVYLSRNASTIPDQPFNPARNDGTDMPTLKSGIYNFSTVNHRGQYAALNVNSANVVRFNGTGNYYNSTSSGINIHKRSADSINNTWVNSAGCLIVGNTATNSSYNEYAQFIQAVGIVNSNDSSSRCFRYSVNGKVVVDRTYAHDYMKNIGYINNAITLIG